MVCTGWRRLKNASALASILKPRNLLVSSASPPPSTQVLRYAEQKVNWLTVRHQVKCRGQCLPGVDSGARYTYDLPTRLYSKSLSRAKLTTVSRHLAVIERHSVAYSIYTRPLYRNLPRPKRINKL